MVVNDGRLLTKGLRTSNSPCSDARDERLEEVRRHFKRIDHFAAR
jgi:hypothetical protein